ncbi:MAG: hypothetical protein R3F29_06185 [Planctomycetota bacterium]
MNSFKTLLVSLLSCAVALAQVEKPDARPLPPPPVEESSLQPDLVGFGAAYERAGAPRILVLCGLGAVPTAQADTVGARAWSVFDPTAESDVLRAQLEGYLLKSPRRVELVDAEGVAAARESEAARLKVMGEAESVRLLAQRLDADIVFVVWLRPDAAQFARYRVVCEIHHVGRGRKIAGTLAFDWKRDGEIETIRLYGRQIAYHMMRQFAAWNAPRNGNEHVLKVSGLDLRASLALAKRWRGVEGVDSVKTSGGLASGGRGSLAEFRVTSKLDAGDLVLELLVAAEEAGVPLEAGEFGEGFVTLVMPPPPVAAVAQGEVEPDFDLLLDDGPGGDYVRAKVLEAYESAGRPSLAVMVNRRADDLAAQKEQKPETPRDGGEARPTPTEQSAGVIVTVNVIDGPVLQGGGQRPAAPPPVATDQAAASEPDLFDNRVVEDLLSKHFLRLGLVVKDQQTVRRRIVQKLREATRGNVSERELVEAMAGDQGVDVFVHCVGHTVDPTRSGSGAKRLSYSFRAIQVNDGLTLAADVWSNARDNEIGTGNVGGEQEMARETAILLIRQLYAQWGPPRTLTVMVRNAKTQREVLDVMDAFAKLTAKVKDTRFERHDAGPSGGVGTFTLRYRGTYEELIREINARQAGLQFNLDTEGTTRETVTVRIK